ncbi:MAG: hypothetical protein EBU51_08035, partial [Synechococcaceae bacterium WB6_3A_227]|nr:hypothetical protein [Synechococcaceae bacterium WB6_3A_227]
TSLVAHLLQQAGVDAPACGNIGSSATELALARTKTHGPQWAVVELSSFQIEAAPTVAPRIGIWTTLTPDHLDSLSCQSCGFGLQFRSIATFNKAHPGALVMK